MNWYKTLFAASIITLDYDHKSKGKIQNQHGNAGGTATFRDLGDAKHNGEYEGSALMQGVPSNWDSMRREEKAQYINNQVESGKLKFPSTIEDWLSTDFNSYPYNYLKSIIICLNKTHKLPNFSRDWVESNWDRGTLPSQMKTIMDNAMKAFPVNKKKPYMLYNDASPTMLENYTYPTDSKSNQVKRKPFKKKETPYKTTPEFDEIYDWKSDRYIKVPKTEAA